jgi:transcriptional regulator
MHPNAAFRWEDRDVLRAFATEIGFGTVFAATPDGPRVAHIPFVFLDDDRIGFHLARGNGLTKHLDGTEALFVVTGPDAYISPDWYGIDDQVPTWNYLALELQGAVRKLDRDGLAAQVDAVSAVQESRLAPKSAWTKDKMSDGLFDKMLGAITGFEMQVTAWRGTAKLGQNKTPDVRENAAKALDAAGQKAMAHLMRTLPTPNPSLKG